MSSTALPRPRFDLKRPVRADVLDFFTPDEVAKSRSYQRPLQIVSLVSTVWSLVVLIAYTGLHINQAVVSALHLTAWPLRLVAILVMFTLVSTVLELPFSIWAEFGHERKWGFSTTTTGTFIVDQFKNLALGLAISLALTVPLWWVIRATPLWWLYGTILVLFFSVVLAFLLPTVIMPIFNKFTPLEDESLQGRLAALASRAGVSISGYFVMDASKRTRHDNAFFAGLGGSRRVVVYDNLLKYEPEAVEVVVAHEIGHWRRNHIYRQLALGTVTTVLTFLLLKWFVELPAALSFAGTTSIGDPASVTLFLLGFTLISLVLKYPGLWVSRWFEREADFDALELTGARDAYVTLWRTMSDRNLPDLDPSWWSRVNASHPPMAERMAFADAWERSRA